MSDRMSPVSFSKLLEQVICEYKESHTVFGVRKLHRISRSNPLYDIFDETPEMPFGPAAGPNTQLAQNIAAAYFAGSRFFELKTVQKLDGEDLPVSKPCILAEDEGYNVEWSTELTVPDAYKEYVKAWWLCKIMAVELELGSPDGFVFNMSVGYDLEGIKTPKIDAFIEGLKCASGKSPYSAGIWEECCNISINAVNTGLLKKFTLHDIDSISTNICRSATLSTLHGCPAEDIERIASYLLTEKKLHTFIKLNPTLLGYDQARCILDEMGYGYVQFGSFHFEDDLQYDKAVPMLKRLQALADNEGLEFGVKITNTFPVDIKRNELPGNEMYMSGRALLPLSLSVAEKLSRDFGGRLRISYSGGADAYNILSIFRTGIWPITFATTILKPGGYNRIAQIAGLFDPDTLSGPDSNKAYERIHNHFQGIDVDGLSDLLEHAKADPHHTKPVKTAIHRKSSKKLPLFDCFMSPCSDTCPIGQDITAYMRLVNEGRFLDALKVIILKNPLPNITGTICAHPCMGGCTRRFYDAAVDIRSKKLTAARNANTALEKYLGDIKLHSIRSNGIKVAVIGAGPAGIASAHFLARAGFEPVVYDKRESGGGTVAHVITEQRIPREAITQDIAFAAALGARFVYGKEIHILDELKKEGFRYVIVCVGAGKAGALNLSGDGKTNVINAIEFLERVVSHDPTLDPGQNTAVIGGGNTAMDAARAARMLQTEAGKSGRVFIIYRRDKGNMPADVEELELAQNEGVEFKELLSPFAFTDGKLFCKKNVLGEYDASGRRSPVETEEIVSFPVDTVIVAVGEKIDTALYEELEIDVDGKGLPVTDEHGQSSVDCVYIAGDGLKGPATIVEAIRDASVAVTDIMRRCGINTDDNPIIAEARSIITKVSSGADTDSLCARKGLLKLSDDECPDLCLGCDKVCENCADVCPNHANIAISVPSAKMPQIIHIDRLCNECGNCANFCPYTGRPYKDKLTLFSDLKSFTESDNQGFILLDRENRTFRVRFEGTVTDEEPFSGFCSLHEPLADLIRTLYSEYSYLF
ncbi:MAG: putative selenate reductase subunit YgfK [Lachnospiraceae bacterium]|nr:putative selenate reductase subunit YgfK [Lachnospiraceae bacterium]